MSAYTRVSNDPFAPLVGTDALTEKKEMGGRGDTKIWFDPEGPVFFCGRGVNDPLITYAAFYRDNTKVYVYVNAGKNGLVVTTVQP